MIKLAVLGWGEGRDFQLGWPLAVKSQKMAKPRKILV